VGLITVAPDMALARTRIPKMKLRSKTGLWSQAAIAREPCVDGVTDREAMGPALLL
jgi:hypothetical protein